MKRAETSMNLHLYTPTRTVIDEPVTKVVAESVLGSFCLLPRHTDYLSTLIPGIFMLHREPDVETILACDAGLLVKQGHDVFVAVGQVIQGEDLASLKDTVAREFENLDERSRVCQSAIANLEAHFLRRLLDLELAR